MQIGMQDTQGKTAVVTFESDMAGIPSAPSQSPHQGLIGRDFLGHLKLVYDGPKGTFALVDYKSNCPSFRYI